MTDQYAVSYAPKALDDLRDIYSYIAFSLKAAETAKKQVDRIRKEIRALDAMPLRFAAVDWEPWKSMGMRHFPVNNFVVFYIVDEAAKAVKVIRIVYGGRDMESVLEETE